ncbi:pentapeptide repeat-containing protein [Undibacterium sp. JH2W]|uniref:pentapeptide repeat-containing protein n=1 Tax=Undibacterium sp. JH2W TaxID=3413037 RepID=UPI003BEFF7AC
MENKIYMGHFIVSIIADRTEDGKKERFMTLVGNEVQLHTERSRAMLIRLYTTNYSVVLASTPTTIGGYEREFYLHFAFSGGADTGHANLVFPAYAVHDIYSKEKIGPEGGETIIMRDGSLLCCSAGHDQTPHLFRLHPERIPTSRPNPWKFEPAPVPSFAGGDLRFVNFQNDRFILNAPGANLSHSSLYGARLCGSTLNNVNFDHSNNSDTAYGEGDIGSTLDDSTWNHAGCLETIFRKCSLQRADFSKAEFSSSKILPRDAYKHAIRNGPPKFIKADLQDADFSTSDLRGVDFTSADLRGAKLKGALMDKCILTGADLSGADLSDTDLRNVIFDDKRPRLSPEKISSGDRRTILRNTQLKASLLGLNWNNLDLTSATIYDIPTDLSELKAKQANLTNIDFTGCKLTDADFRLSALSKVDFTSADLSNANFSDLDLRNVTLTCATVSNVQVDGTDLSGLDLRTVKISKPIIGSVDTKRRTKLCKTKLNANLFGKVWTALDLTDASIAKLTTTDLTGMQADDALLTGVTLSDANFNSNDSDTTKIVSSFRRALFHGADLQRTQFKNAILEGAQFGAYRPVFRMSADEADRQGLPAFWAQRLNLATLHAEEPLRHLDANNNNPALLHRYESRANGERELLLLTTAVPANLSNAYLAGANLTNANLEEVTANGVHIYGGEDGRSQLAGAVMTRIKLVGANLGSADLTKAQLQGANLNGANLVGAKLDGADLSPAKSGTTSLTDLTGAYLAGASFDNTKLNGAILTGAAVPGRNGVYLFTLSNAQAITEIRASKFKNLRFKDYRSDLSKLNLDELSKKLIKEGFSINAGAKLSLVASDPVKWEIIMDNLTYRLDLLVEESPVKLTVNDDKQLNTTFLSNHLAALQNNQLDVLILAFKEIGISLTANAKIVAKDPQRPSNWKIHNNSPDPDLLLSTGLYKTGKNDLYVGTPWDLARNEFKIQKMGLQAGAKLKTGDKDQWLLSNEIADLNGIHTGYVEFRLIAEETGSIAVFGTTLQVVRLTAENKLQVFPTVLLPPKGFDQHIMDGETYCPNGQRLQDLGVGTWDEKWLRTNASPKPPTCVPSKDGWCPIDIPKIDSSIR